MSRPVFSVSCLTFQSTPPARGATGLKGGIMAFPVISIHAPREGGDAVSTDSASLYSHFNPRPPRGGRRWCQLIFTSRCFLFQSTPPARGATSPPVIRQQRKAYFNPRPPRGGRQNRADKLEQYRDFNPRPPRGGATVGLCIKFSTRADFNPRPPRGGRPPACRHDSGPP